LSRGSSGHRVRGWFPGFLLRVGSSCKTATADAERYLEKEHVRVDGTWEPASKKRRI